MERTSTVARDGSSLNAAALKLSLICCLPLIASTLWSADPARPRNGGLRPQRRVQQSQFSDRSGPQFTGTQQLDDGFGQESNTQAEQPVKQASASELPEHIDPEHPLVPALKMAYASRATLSKIRDYTGQFVKKEWVNDHYVVHNMDVKFREQPFSVYLKFRAPNDGRQVLYVKGMNNGQLLAKEGGLKGILTVRLNPTDQLAMSESRHPITQFGIANMLGTVIKQWEEEGKYGAIDVQYYPNAKLGSYPVRVIQSSHPAKYANFKYHMTRLYLDDKSLFPVRVDQFDWPTKKGGSPVPVEIYMYSGVQTNIPLTDADFDPRTYRFN